MKQLSLLSVILCSFPLFSQQSKILVSKNLEIIPISDNSYIHVSYAETEWGRVASNGLILVQKDEAFLLDTPMDEEVTKELVKFVKDSLRATITGFVPNHWHSDCLGGLAYLHKIGVKSYANIMTLKFAGEKGYEKPLYGFRDSLTIPFHNINIQCYYPGPAHALDNIVVYIPEEKILFGGCMVKEMKATTMGNIADADTKAWPATIKKVIIKYPLALLVIPGHGAYGGRELLVHTLELVSDYNK